MSNSTLTILSGIFKSRCPKCGKGEIYQNKSVFPLKNTLKTVEHCPNCDQKIKFDNDYAPGMNYAISVVVYILGFIVYHSIWGISLIDNSLMYAFIFTTIVVILLQPWIMRISKTIYLYLFIQLKGE